MNVLATNSARLCPACGFAAQPCLCPLPRLETRSRLTLAVHTREARKPTNTGQLAARCLVGSEVVIVGDRARQPSTVLKPNELGLWLFPAEDAVPIERFAGWPSPVSLAVPDGNWRQAAKMRRRVPGASVRVCVTFASASVTESQLRAEHRDGGLATLEAIAAALAILDGETGVEVAGRLREVFHVFQARMRATSRRPPPNQ